MTTKEQGYRDATEGRAVASSSDISYLRGFKEGLLAKLRWANEAVNQFSQAYPMLDDLRLVSLRDRYRELYGSKLFQPVYGDPHVSYDMLMDTFVCNADDPIEDAQAAADDQRFTDWLNDVAVKDDDAIRQVLVFKTASGDVTTLPDRAVKGVTRNKSTGRYDVVVESPFVDEPTVVVAVDAFWIVVKATTVGSYQYEPGQIKDIE